VFAKALTGTESARFSQSIRIPEFRRSEPNSSLNDAKTLIQSGLKKIEAGGCTISGHWLVDGLHSIENART
jgi:hypothetical protein